LSFGFCGVRTPLRPPGAAPPPRPLRHRHHQRPHHRGTRPFRPGIPAYRPFVGGKIDSIGNLSARPALAPSIGGVGNLFVPRPSIDMLESVGEHHPLSIHVCTVRRSIRAAPRKSRRGESNRATKTTPFFAPDSGSTTTNIIFKPTGGHLPNIFFPQREARHGINLASYVGRHAAVPAPWCSAIMTSDPPPRARTMTGTRPPSHRGRGAVPAFSTSPRVTLPLPYAKPES